MSPEAMYALIGVLCTAPLSLLHHLFVLPFGRECIAMKEAKETRLLIYAYHFEFTSACCEASSPLPTSDRAQISHCHCVIINIQWKAVMAKIWSLE